MRVFILLFIFVVILAALVIWPGIDLAVSGWFYQNGKGFLYAKRPLFLFLEGLAYYGSRALAFGFAVLAILAVALRKPIFSVDAKRWLFLLLALLIGPGLIANLVFKDHWGRARPREVIEFGGNAAFAPALMPQPAIHKNGSFVSGDASFGFFLPAFAYAVPLRGRGNPSRRLFWGGMAAASVFSLARLFMGAHFLSDLLFAAFFVLLASAGLHAVMFGGALTKSYWRNWLFTHEKDQKA